MQRVNILPLAGHIPFLTIWICLYLQVYAILSNA